MSQPAPRPLPSLPIELKKEILHFCDQDTLARTSQASLAFLQLSSPLLYKHIEIKGPEALRNLISLVADKRHPDLDPYLDLSLIDSLTYLDDSKHPYRYGDSGERSRLPDPLPLHHLCIRLESGLSNSRIFSLFDPMVCTLSGVDIPEQGGRVSTLVGQAVWTRLRELRHVDAASLEPLGHLLSDVNGTVELFYDFTTVQKNAYALAWLVEDLSHQGDLPQVETVTIYIQTQDQKAYLLAELAESPLLSRTTVHVKTSPSSSSSSANPSNTQTPVTTT